MELLVAKEVIENILYPNEHISNLKNTCITGGLVFFSYIIAMLTCDLGIVLELGVSFHHVGFIMYKKLSRILGNYCSLCVR
jgi:hypothetical protein